VIERLRRLPGGGGVPAVGLLERTVELLLGHGLDFAVDYCVELDGDVRLAVVARDLGREMSPGDPVRAGLHLETSASGDTATRVCERLFRVVCCNGALVEFERTQAATLVPATWERQLEAVVARSFHAEGFRHDAARFRATLNQMLASPYELLCHLAARRLISDDEQSAIQHEFTRADDPTLYGFINAVTRIAGRLREDDEWRRSVELERLGGEILRGDHQPPVSELALR
jgi:hypothetical protein